MLFLQSHNETQSVFWEHASISLYHLTFQISLGKKDIFCLPARDTNSQVEEQVYIQVQVQSCSGLCMTVIPPLTILYKGVTNQMGCLFNHSEK